MTAANADLSPLIHLVDDDDAVRNSLALLISTIGLRVQTWADPLAFSTQFDRQGIGAVVLDVRMPGIGGLALLAQLVEQGVDSNKIDLTLGYGSRQNAVAEPIPNSPEAKGMEPAALEALRRQNRRIAIKVARTCD